MYETYLETCAKTFWAMKETCTNICATSAGHMSKPATLRLSYVWFVVHISFARVWQCVVLVLLQEIAIVTFLRANMSIHLRPLMLCDVTWRYPLPRTCVQHWSWILSKRLDVYVHIRKRICVYFFFTMLQCEFKWGSVWRSMWSLLKFWFSKLERCVH